MIRVLTIDDSKVIHAILAQILEPDHAELTHAYDGSEGFEVLMTRGVQAFDLILLDWEMPKLNGLETLKKIRTAGLKIPVIMLTTKNLPDDISRALEGGADEYIMKPFVSDILLDKIHGVVGKAA